jgi:hypothetical protein
MNTRLKNVFADRNYREDIEALFIGLILTGPDSESFHHVETLKYRKKFTLKSSLTGTREYLGTAARRSPNTKWTAEQCHPE